MKSTNEFVVTNGTDADLWGDIDSEIDDKWGNEVWNYIQNKYNNKKHGGSSHNQQDHNPHKRGGNYSLGSSSGSAPDSLKNSPKVDKLVDKFLKRTELGYSDGYYRNLPPATRGKQKAKIVAEISELSGLPPETVNDMVRQWTYYGAGRLPDSLIIQDSVSKEFDVPLSKWQENNIADVGLDSRFSAEDAQSFSKAVYQNTQTKLKEAGFDPDDEIVLYRAYSISNFEGKKGEVVNYEGNAIESWSFEKEVSESAALYEGGNNRVTLAMKVPVKNIFSTCMTGQGCWPEQEFIIFGSLGSTALVTRVK